MMGGVGLRGRCPRAPAGETVSPRTPPTLKRLDHRVAAAAKRGVGGTFADFGKHAPAAVALYTGGGVEDRGGIGNAIGDESTRRRQIRGKSKARRNAKLGP